MQLNLKKIVHGISLEKYKSFTGTVCVWAEKRKGLKISEPA